MKNLMLITLCIIFSSNLIFAQKVNFKINALDNAKQGEEITFEVEVEKNDIAGFARLQIDFPEGFAVSVKQTHGASFSFKEGKARFLWMSLPGDPKLTVSCVVKSDIAGQYKIEGVFSYVLNNETLRSDLPVFLMNIGEGGAIVADIPKEDVSKKIEPEKKSRKDPETLEAERKAREEATLKAKQEEEEKKEENRIRKESEEKVAKKDVKKEEPKREIEVKESTLVENETKSDAIEPEVKKEENLVEETNAPKIEEKQQEDLKSTEDRQMEVLSDKTNEDALEEERKAKEAADEKARNEKLLREKVEADRLAKEKLEAERKTKIEAEKKIVAEVEKPVNTQTQSQTRSTSYNSSSNTKADFRVQVGASRGPAAVGEYRRLEKSFSEFSIVQNVGSDGWYRYTIGSFSRVEDAKQLHGKVAALGFDSFVVAFKDGQRTTIADVKKILGQ